MSSMSDSVHDLLVRGIAAAKADEKGEARRYMEWALRLDPLNEQRLQAWYWLSQISDDPQEKRRYLVEILSAEPNHHLARRELAILDGRLAPEEVIDPDRLQSLSIPVSAQAGAQRFVCPHCGGPLIYTPDGQALYCEYCEIQHSLAAAGQRPLAEAHAQDFITEMARLKGHVHPEGERAFVCQACGANFTLSAERLATTCPYCESVYVVEQVEEPQAFAVEALIPFAVSQENALDRVRAWMSQERITPDRQEIALRGVYLPFWLFSISTLAGLSADEPGVAAHPQSPVFIFDNILTPATHLLPPEKCIAASSFDLSRLAPFDPAYLADWQAETYQVPLSEASLAARLLALERIRQATPPDLLGLRAETGLTSMDLWIRSYRLILLPFWVCAYTRRRQRHALLVNGQSGKVLR